MCGGSGVGGNSGGCGGISSSNSTVYHVVAGEEQGAQRTRARDATRAAVVSHVLLAATGNRPDQQPPSGMGVRLQFISYECVW